VMSMLRYVGYTDQSASDFIMFLREKSWQGLKPWKKADRV
jgi:hypothetical protein